MHGRTLQTTRRIGVVVGYALVYLLIWAGLVMLFAAAGIRYFWGEISVGQMLLNLVSVETDGGGGAIVWIGILVVGVAPVLITAGIALWQAYRRRRRRLGRVAPSGRSPWLARSVATVLVGTLVIGGTTAFARTVGVADYIEASNSDYDIADYYSEPVVTSAEDKRNLVLIYLESGEATLEDDQLFEKDAFAPLKDVTGTSDGWQTVENFQQYEGGGWTMSGLVSTMCGVPLKAAGADGSSGGSDKPDDDVESYLGGITCLGDVLADNGYTNVFLGGANSSFAAKDTFLKDHGYSEVKGLRDWRIAGESENDFRSDWGLSDERLLENAKTEIDRLYADAQESGQPFNLSLLTLDTHEPVHVYDYCDVDTEQPVTSVFSCSMTLMAGFVDYMEEQGYLEDTAVVIMGDHLKHMNAGDAFHEQLDDHENRTIFNRIRVPGTTPPLRDGVDQLNMYPTILEAAGLTVADSAAGVGISAFEPRVPAASAQGLDGPFYDELVTSLSPRFFERAWAGGNLPQ
ncbi:sulfatase-like hydrolase/transferase [Arthrobacter agilis]|uniref:sulfatase-like hydrolase/transferase n=1 Tax=Arthrobacter agilis TaxID=37921 RepID=UPI00236549F6|nr:sulfatase-like hydrolase/transferase [Arthrobacter agilis]WDF33989.1 sulfatase-like hydrolase/transferase [Arthrobacter agilis]